MTANEKKEKKGFFSRIGKVFQSTAKKKADNFYEIQKTNKQYDSSNNSGEYSEAASIMKLQHSYMTSMKKESSTLDLIVSILAGASLIVMFTIFLIFKYMGITVFANFYLINISVLCFLVSIASTLIRKKLNYKINFLMHEYYASLFKIFQSERRTELKSSEMSKDMELLKKLKPYILKANTILATVSSTFLLAGIIIVFIFIQL